MRETRKTIWSQEIAVAMGLAMLLGITGCAEKEADPVEQENTEGQQSDGAEDLQEGGGDADDAGADADKGDSVEDLQEGGDSADASGTQPDTADGVQTFKASEGTEYLGGKIWKLQEDSMTFAHTSLVEDSMVTILDVEDAEKIQVEFTEETKVEHWIIQDGGAGIDMQEAAFSDLKEGMGVELEGYYDGETFVATKVIMEDYK